MNNVLTMTATAPSPNAGLPRQNSAHLGYAGYVPHDLKYSAAFEDSLIDTVLSSDTPQSGLRILSDDGDEQPVPGQSVRAEQINWDDLPQIDEDELPLPLEDSRRVYASAVPGVRLTHPGGYLEGGPGLDPDMDTFPDDFFANQPQPITTPSALSAAVDKEVEASVALLKQRLEARREAKEKNERIGRELKGLVDQHEMELKIQRRMAEDQRRKKEAREKKRRGRDGGG